ncbi:MAG: hypothetical protein IKW90_13030 [Lachnospiraceae bacterium]|nr:hypothetical protein [Lachnospiraceae bacterium]
MKNYVSPVILDNEELAEGVYASGSGDGCWTLTIKRFDQAPEVGMDCYVVHFEATHNATDNHSSNSQIFVFNFSADVEFNDEKTSSVDLYAGDGTSTLKVKRNNFGNPTGEFVGISDLYVKCKDSSVSCYGGYVICEKIYK